MQNATVRSHTIGGALVPCAMCRQIWGALGASGAALDSGPLQWLAAVLSACRPITPRAPAPQARSAPACRAAQATARRPASACSRAAPRQPTPCTPACNSSVPPLSLPPLTAGRPHLGARQRELGPGLVWLCEHNAVAPEDAGQQHLQRPRMQDASVKRSAAGGAAKAWKQVQASSARRHGSVGRHQSKQGQGTPLGAARRRSGGGNSGQQGKHKRS